MTDFVLPHDTAYVDSRYERYITPNDGLLLLLPLLFAAAATAVTAALSGPKLISIVHINSLVGTGHIDKAAIISAAGDSTWAASSGFTVMPSPPLCPL